MPVIEMRGITREYRMESSVKIRRHTASSKKETEDVVVRALRGIDFSAEEGEFISVMGPSGSGKSTLMNILGCLDKPSNGSYTLDGIETSKSDSNTFAYIRNRKIGFVFQSFNLLARTTALENVELPLFYRRKEKSDQDQNEKRPSLSGISNPFWYRNSKSRKEKAMAALREVGLEDRMDHFPSQLSGGQQQRVAIARAMVNDPAFILADEPTGNLDSGMSLEIMGLFQQLNKQGKTIIMVTHEPELAAFTRRIITLRDGRLISDKKVEKPRDAIEDLARWKKDNALLSDAELGATPLEASFEITPPEAASLGATT